MAKVKNKFILWWLIAFVGFLMLYFFCGKKVEEAPAWCDYKLYWEIGKSLYAENSFSLFTLSDPFRGTILPIIFGSMYYIGITFFGSETIGFMIVSAYIYSALYGVLLPKFIQILGPLKNNLFTVFGLLGLSYIFWYGIFLYPLSDVLAFVFMVCACCFLQRQRECENICRKIAYGFGIGACSYCAYNIRSIYVVAFCTVFDAVLLQNIRNEKGLIC